MATFTQVKAILDSLVAGRDLARMKLRHGGAAFSWQTAAALRSAVAIIGTDTYPLIDGQYVGNGQADQTYLIRLLSGPIDEDSLPRMPLAGPYASPAQIQIIRDWINAGAQDDPAFSPHTSTGTC